VRYLDGLLLLLDQADDAFDKRCFIHGWLTCCMLMVGMSISLQAFTERTGGTKVAVEMPVG
jgi:hypothetical protein